MWFEPADASDRSPGDKSEDADDNWGGLATLGDIPKSSAFDEVISRFDGGDPTDTVLDEDLPFMRLKVIPELEEEEVETIRTSRLLLLFGKIVQVFI